MEDIVCRICGESKPLDEFHHIMYFTRYKKHRVFWCKDCQKMYIDFKTKGNENSLKKIRGVFSVSFE